MSEYVLADSAEDDLEKIAEYTVNSWGVEQARRYGTALAAHFRALAANDVKTKAVFTNWPELLVSRCQHHYVFSLQRATSPITILAVFHENMDLPARLRERLDTEDGLIE